MKKQIYDVFDELATSLQQEDVFTDEELEELFVTFGKETREQDATPAHVYVVNLEDLCLYFLRIYNILD